MLYVHTFYFVLTLLLGFYLFVVISHQMMVPSGVHDILSPKAVMAKKKKMTTVTPSPLMNPHNLPRPPVSTISIPADADAKKTRTDPPMVLAELPLSSSVSSSSASVLKVTTYDAKKCKPSQFAVKVHKMITEVDQTDPSIMRWVLGGDAFHIETNHPGKWEHSKK